MNVRSRGLLLAAVVVSVAPAAIALSSTHSLDVPQQGTLSHATQPRPLNVVTAAGFPLSRVTFSTRGGGTRIEWYDSDVVPTAAATFARISLLVDGVQRDVIGWGASFGSGDDTSLALVWEGLLPTGSHVAEIRFDQAGAEWEIPRASASDSAAGLILVSALPHFNAR